MVNGGRCIEHYVPARVIFGKGNEITNGLTSSKEGAEPVESERDASMRGSSIFKSPQEETKFMHRFFHGHTKGSKHFFLQLPLKDPDGSTPDLVSVQHHIIGI